MSISLTVYDASFLFWSALIYALIEIELEGKNGWCEKIPTARNVIGTFTLYHIYMILFLMIMISMIFIPRFYIACNTSEFTPWSAVCCFVFYVVAWFLLEDFLWFVFNPYYTLCKYNKEEVKWHTQWVGAVPLHNVLGILALAAIAFAEGSWFLFLATAMLTGWTFLSILVAPFYHEFYEKIRGKSD